MNRFRNNSSFWPQAAVLILVAIAYWVAVRLGLLFVAQPEGVAFIWPASGLALAILLLSPKRQWPILLAVIFVTNAAGNWSGGNPLLVSLGFALANILEALLGAWALTWLCKSKITFGRTVEIFALFGVAIFSNGLTALLGAAVPALAFGAPFMNTWLVWWISDGLGMLLVTPFIVTWAASQNILQSASPRRIVEAVLLVLVLVMFAWLLFGPFTVAEEPVLRNYMLFPLLIWLAFRYSPRGMASALILLAAIAIWNTLQGHGIFGFAGQTVTQHLLSVQKLLGVTTFTGLLLSAIVAEQKRGEGALKQNEEKYRKLVDLTPDGLLIHVGGTIIYSNNAAANILGLASPGDMVGKKLMDFIHPDYRSIVAERIRQITKNKDDAPLIEEKLVRPDGAVIDAEVTAISFNYAGENAVQVVFRDITERKQAEEVSRRAEAALAEAQRISHLGSWDWDLGTGKIQFSDEMFHLVGMIHGDAEITRAVFAKFLHPDEAEQILQKFLQSTAAHFSGIEHRIVQPDGKIRNALSRIKAYCDENGKPLRLLGSTQDITERKQAEKALHESEARYRQIVELSQDLIVIHQQGKVVFVNEAGVRMVGATSPDQIVGRSVLEFVPTSRKEIAQQRMQRPLADGKSPVYEQKLRRLDGTEVDIEVVGTPFRYQGEVAIQLVVRDVTERKRAEEEIRQLNAKLEQRVEERTRELREAQEQLVRQEKLAVLGQLAGGVGHELRNPLAVIINAVYFLKLVQPEADEKIKDYLGMIERETHNAEMIIADLLDFARVQSAEREAVSVSELVRQTLERFPAPASVEVTLEIPSDLLKVYADPRQMTQVLGNLTVNACQAMPKGGQLSVISDQCSVNSEQWVRITIKDTGVGIPPENMRKLFEPLFTTKAKGIGLGLAVSQKLAEANGGRIEVQSEPGVGSTFTLWLPIQGGER